MSINEVFKMPLRVKAVGIFNKNIEFELRDECDTGDIFVTIFNLDKEGKSIDISDYATSVSIKLNNVSLGPIDLVCEMGIKEGDTFQMVLKPWTNAKNFDALSLCAICPIQKSKIRIPIKLDCNCCFEMGALQNYIDLFDVCPYCGEYWSWE